MYGNVLNMKFTSFPHVEVRSTLDINIISVGEGEMGKCPIDHNLLKVDYAHFMRIRLPQA